MRDLVYGALRINIAALATAATVVWAPTAPVSASGLHPLDRLAADLTQVAGRPVAVDPRLLLPACAAVEYRPEPGGIAATCASPAWTVHVPVADAAAQPAAAVTARSLPPAQPSPAFRRGDRVSVAAGGTGYEVTLTADVEGQAPGGRLLLRGPAGQRLNARLGPDGRVELVR